MALRHKYEQHGCEPLCVCGKAEDDPSHQMNPRLMQGNSEAPNTCHAILHEENSECRVLPRCVPVEDNPKPKRMMVPPIEFDEGFHKGVHEWREGCNRFPKCIPVEDKPEPPKPTPPHDYTSTACQHAKHSDCRKECKFCGVACQCDCHKSKPRRWVVEEVPLHPGMAQGEGTILLDSYFNRADVRIIREVKPISRNDLIGVIIRMPEYAQLPYLQGVLRELNIEVEE